MAEYINREKIIKALKENTTEMESDIYYGSNIGVPEDEIEGIVNEIPTEDAVPVVRCCDCKYRQENPDIDNTCYLTCNKIYGIQGTIAPDDYCSYGKRRE